MQFARYLAHGEIAYGVVEDGMVKQITTTPFEDYQVTDHAHPLEHVQLLAPVVPGKVVAIALNYSTHLGERPAPKRVEGFFKTHNCIIANGENIVLLDHLHIRVEGLVQRTPAPFDGHIAALDGHVDARGHCDWL